MLRFVAFHPLPAEQRLAVTGDHPALGNWHRPLPMRRRRPRTPRDEVAHSWERAVAFPDPVDDVAYRYVVLADEPRWEREPDRHVAVPRFDEVVDGFVETDDRNIVTDLHIDRVTNHVWVGPYPQSAGDIDVLAATGITAVVNLQTDDDLHHRGVDLDQLRCRLGSHDIELWRLPIRDFDECDLVRGLPAAVGLLHRLVDAGHRTYVHCTAGMGRAPAVVLAYLVHRGHPLKQASTLLTARHPASAPNTSAVARAIGGV